MGKATGWEMSGASSATCLLFAGDPGLAQGCWGVRPSSPGVLRGSSCFAVAQHGEHLAVSCDAHIPLASRATGTCTSGAFPGLEELPPLAPGAKTHVMVCPTWLQFWGGCKSRSQGSLAEGSTLCNGPSILQHPGETQAAPDPHRGGRQEQRV